MISAYLVTTAIQKATRGPKRQVWLGQMESIKKAVEEMKARYPKVNVAFPAGVTGEFSALVWTEEDRDMLNDWWVDFTTSCGGRGTAQATGFFEFGAKATDRGPAGILLAACKAADELGAEYVRAATEGTDGRLMRAKIDGAHHLLRLAGERLTLSIEAAEAVARS